MKRDVDTNAIGNQSRSYRRLVVSLAVCLLLLLTAGGLYWQTAQRQQQFIRPVQENLLWVSMQFEREVQRWRLALNNTTIGTQADRDQLEFRLDILYSRYVTLRQGELGEAINEDSQLSAILIAISTGIDSLDRVFLEHLADSHSHRSSLVAKTDSLLSISNDLLNRVVSLRSEEATRNRNELQNSLIWLTVSVALLLIATVYLIFMLVRALRIEQSQALSASRMAEQLDETARQAEAANETKSAFLATMSHEIRTPLTGVLGMLDVLMDEPLEGKPRSYAQTAQKSANHLREIVNDILDFSSIEAGKLEVISESFLLSDLFEDIESVTRVQLRDKPVTFELQQEIGFADWVEGDRTRLRQVIFNLISNAIKFTDAGKITLKVAWQPQATLANKGVLRIEVLDTGTGIDASMSHQVFDAFSQIDSASDRRTGGTGLGLSICKQLIKLMGGDIDFSSEVGKGSLFWFDVPLRIIEITDEESTKALAFWGFDETDITAITQAAEILGWKSQPVVLQDPSPPVGATVLINWQEPFNERIDAIQKWRQNTDSGYNLVAIVSAERVASAYDFIKAGGDSMLVRPIDPNKLVERLRQ